MTEQPFKGRLYKYEVPIDGKWHEIELVAPLEGIIQHVACQHRDAVAFWSVWTDHPDTEKLKFEFRVFATGDEFDINETMYCGTALSGPYVWHLLARGPKED